MSDSSIKKNSGSTLQLPPDESDNPDALPKDPLQDALQLSINKIENMTSKTSVVLKGNQLCKVVGYSDTGLMLEVPVKCCTSGHHLQIELEINADQQAPKTMIVTAKVENLTKTPHLVDSLSLKLLQYPEKEWGDLITSLQDRQSKLLEYISKVSGV